MSAFPSLLVAETRLFVRDPITWLVALVLPAAILAILGTVLGNEPSAELEGRSIVEIFAPSLIVVTLATLSVNVFPMRLATYRQSGYLRRLATVPASPAALIGAQLTISLVAAAVAVLLLIAVGHLAFGVPLPANVPGFLLAVGLGAASMFSIALLIAGVARTSGAGQALGLPLFFAAMFLGGVYLPRVFLPEVIVQVGEYTPPGVQGIQDAWLGEAPDILPLVVLAAITLIAGIAAARSFRWQ